MREEGVIDRWVAYRSPEFSAKETTILPGRSVTLRDAACYGLILLQGHGTLGVWDIAAPTMIRFGQLTDDEFFVTEEAAAPACRSPTRVGRILSSCCATLGRGTRTWTLPEAHRCAPGTRSSRRAITLHPLAGHAGRFAPRLSHRLTPPCRHGRIPQPGVSPGP